MRELATDSGLAAASVAKVGATLSSIFGFAVYEDRLEHNPVVGLSHPLALASRERRFDDDAIAAIWKILTIHSSPHEKGDGHGDELSRLAPQTCLAIRFLILTLSRRGETCGARWEEIDRKARTWTIPRERTKSGRAEVKPLSDVALAILDAAAVLPDASPIFVFPSPGDPDHQLDNMRPTRALARLCERLDIPHGSPHDFRRSGATILAGQYGFSGFTIGRVLGHQVHEGAAVTSVYNRFDHAPEKRRALDTWAAHITGLTEGKDDSNIVPFAAVAAE
jgi:integrase